MFVRSSSIVVVLKASCYSKLAKMPRPSRRYARVVRIAWLSAVLAAVSHIGPCLVSAQVDYQDEATRMDAQIDAIFQTAGPTQAPGVTAPPVDESSSESSLEVAMVSQDEVDEAQRAWGDAIVGIGVTEGANLDFQASASQMVDSLYAFGVADVLFKPTMAERTPFRTTRAGVLSYFISGPGVTTAFPEDTEHGGFARHPWSAVRFEPAGIWLGAGAALSMGHYHFMDSSQVEHTAEFSFAYVRDVNGTLRIALHHSSFPYCGEEFVNAEQCTLPAAAPVDSSQQVSPQRRLDLAPLTQSAVSNAEQSWGSGIVSLGRAAAADVHQSAVDFVRQSYSYGDAPAPWTGSGALFKPTRAREAPFRTTLDGAVSYFVGGDAAFPEDHGFALAPFGSVRFDSAGTTRLSPTLVVTMGTYFFTDSLMAEHRAEYSLAFVPGDAEAGPKIALHHSSFPFCSTCAASSAAAAASPVQDAPVAPVTGTEHHARSIAGICSLAVLFCCGVVFALLSNLRGNAFEHFMQSNPFREQSDADADEESAQE